MQACTDHHDIESDRARARRLSSSSDGASEPPISRDEVVTMPYTDPLADTLAATPSSFRAATRSDWCVDLGHELASMTTFELWQSIERAQVLAHMRVWREGMECWTPVGEIAEFTWALASTPPPGEAPEPEPELAAEATTGPVTAPVAETTPAPLSRTSDLPSLHAHACIEPSLHAPPAEPRATSPAASELPPESRTRPVPQKPSGARWIGLGSAVAALAIVSALAVSRGAAPEPPATPAPVLAQQGEGAVHASEIDGSHDRGPLSAAPPPSDEDLPAAMDPPIRHEDRGQRRQPRGGRRSYGR